LIEALPPSQDPGAVVDRLYLRSALADVFRPLGIEGDAAYRAAARVRILLAQPKAEKSASAPHAIVWEDPDIVWLTGLHEAQGHRYFNKEAHEQLAWWMLLPELIVAAGEGSAGKSAPVRKALRGLADEIAAAVTLAHSSGYRLDQMVPPAAGATSASTTTGSVESAEESTIGAPEGAASAKGSKRVIKP
jgi:hypothetical protein